MTRWTSTRLSEAHDTSAFECGTHSLDIWLKTEALRAERAGISATTVWTSPDAPVVKAYYAIAPTLVSRRGLPSRSMSAGYSSIPGYLIGRLALDRSLHGQGLGSQLLLDALSLIVTAAGQGGGRIIAVDAIDDRAAAFYEHHDFIPVSASRRLVMKIATARTALGR